MQSVIAGIAARLLAALAEALPWLACFPVASLALGSLSGPASLQAVIAVLLNSPAVVWGFAYCNELALLCIC